ncbi:MAG: methyltransferase domain-containing protein [Rhodobacteraceae bacterium]|nr:methyltransferase domain-containing protein [Paracoccaceae bacterium]
MTAAATDWSPERYARFADLRLRPARDLVAQVRGLPDGDVIDLGCGNGPVAETLAEAFAGRRLIGVDASPAMLAKARETGRYTALIEADIAGWSPDRPPALIFSNAALHWLGDHADLLPRLAGLLAPGGTLAVQMPRQTAAPSHRFLRDIAAALHPDRFDFSHWMPPVQPAEGYWRMLAPLGEVTAWETEYVQRLDPSPDGHPVRRFTESTAMRPFLDKLTPDEAEAFTAAYEEALGVAYPLMPDGAALFPFRRCFFTLRVAG